MKTALGTINVVSDQEAVAAAAAAVIVEVARARPPVGLFLAGGSTARRTFEVVAATSTAADFDGVHVWLVDDRTVALDHPESNAGMILSLWGKGLGYRAEVDGGSEPARFHAMPCRDGIDAQIRDVESALRERGGPAPRPDLAVFGVGTDGHIGGLLPGGSGLTAPGLFAAVNDGARLTATRGMLVTSRRMIFLVAGAAKADIVASMVADPRSAPASIVASEALAAGGEVTWLLDRAAASTLSPAM